MMQGAPETPESETAWVEAVSRMPAAKPLIQHFAAFKAGMAHELEAPVCQSSTWRRLFCFEYGRSDSPFGISSISGRLPRCIAMCNLSGQRGFYHSDRFSLGRILCLAPLRSCERVVSGVEEVFAKASALNASVLICFCLPFQIGVERAYWEVRTIRKTASGTVKDGELFFSIHDAQPRAVPCTAALEHWEPDMLEELCKVHATTVSPVSIDAEAGTDHLNMSHEQTVVMMQMLKVERKKLIDSHKEINDDLRARMRKQALQVKDLESDADARVANVVSSCKVAEETMRKKVVACDESNALLIKQVSAQERLKAEVVARMEGMKLEHAHEKKQAQARQKTLQTQVSSLQSSHAKQVADQARAQKEIANAHAQEISNLKDELEESRKRARAMQGAAEAITKSADEARRNLNAQQLASSSEVETLLMSKSKSDAELDKMRVVCEELKVAAQQQAAQREEERGAACASLEAAQQSAAEATKLVHAAERERGRREHLLKEMEKRAKSLESRLRDAEAETRNAKCAHGVEKAPQSGAGASTNGAVYPHPPQSQHGFPPNFIVDPMLEGMISQLHSALQAITAAARAASASTRAADAANAKLNVLGYREHGNHAALGYGP